MNKELENEISKASLISRYVSPTPLTDKLYKLGDKCNNDLLTTFIISLEICMKKLGFRLLWGLWCGGCFEIIRRENSTRNNKNN